MTRHNAAAPDSRPAPYLPRAARRLQSGSARRLDGGWAASGKQPAEWLEAVHGEMSQVARYEKWL